MTKEETIRLLATRPLSTCVCGVVCFVDGRRALCKVHGGDSPSVEVLEEYSRGPRREQGEQGEQGEAKDTSRASRASRET